MFTAMILAALTGYTTALPVKASCEISTPTLVPQGEAGEQMIGGYSLHVIFTDTAAEPLSKIAFRLNDGTTVSDVGTFSPGVSIEHRLALNDENATSCTADSVVLANGTQISTPMP